jgi:hypothetical protein
MAFAGGSNWSALSAQRLGRCGERLAHLEFSAHGFDVYVPDVDDRSVDFVVRSANRTFTEVQVSRSVSRDTSSCGSAYSSHINACM